MKAFSWLFSFGLLASAGRVYNFDNAPLGQMPPGWTVAMTNHGAAPRWEIRKDTTAPTQPYVLAQVSTDPTDNRFPLAILNSPSLRDGEVSVRIKPVTGRGGEAGGLVWRYRDENNYYLVRANARANDVAVYKIENGRRSALMAGVKHPIPANAWSILKIAVRGSRFQVYLDHRRILQGQDNTFSGPGRVGLWTAADSVTYFDDFRVYPR
ncbi:MAG: hypothetical protein LAP87_02375 [Acidobacteriia bacterium]|nr:hypothetical protein [Terriglobia bacterium]